MHRCSPRLPGRRAVLGTTRATPHSDIAEAVWADLGQVSIRVHSLAAEGQQVITKTRAGQHRLVSLTGSSDDFDPEATAGTFCVSTDNGPEAPDRTLAWRSARQDRELREQGMASVAERDAERRRVLYGQLQREHIERSPFAIMLQQTDMAVLRPGVSPLSPHRPADPLR